MLSLNMTVCLALTLNGVLEVIAPISSLIGVPRVLSGDCLSSHGHLFLSGAIQTGLPSAFGHATSNGDPSKIKMDQSKSDP